MTVFTRLILVSVVVVAVGGCSRREDDKQKRMLDENEQKRVQAILASDLTDKEKGEQLVPFIKSGMTSDELDAILGAPEGFDMGGGICNQHYYGYDLNVVCTDRGRVIYCARRRTETSKATSTMPSATSRASETP